MHGPKTLPNKTTRENCIGFDLLLQPSVKIQCKHHSKQNSHSIIVTTVCKMRMLFILSIVNEYSNYVYCWIFVINDSDFIWKWSEVDKLAKRL